MPASPVIDVEHLTVTYGAFAPLRDVSFHVRPVELYALLGTNGAGRSSTLVVVAVVLARRLFRWEPRR